jgi:hypothetical protein
MNGRSLPQTNLDPTSLAQNFEVLGDGCLGKWEKIDNIGRYAARVRDQKL